MATHDDSKPGSAPAAGSSETPGESASPATPKHTPSSGTAAVQVARAAARSGLPPATVQDEASGHTHKDLRGKELATYVIAALGVVFGDIGTSPLYALRECFHGAHAYPVTETNVLGVLSLIFWALILSISVYYLQLIVRADNRGEGGILALMALALHSAGREAKSRRRALIIILGIFGASLLYGDGVITPAISVLSAWEGLEIAAPNLGGRVIIGLTLVTILGLFLIQRRGTAKVGRLFGPVMVLWFFVLGAIGLASLVQTPRVLMAINPLYAVRFFAENGVPGFIVLGSVFLVVTGGEALYADMGHFGRRPIRFAWYGIVLPGLVLNYFGQGAVLLRNAGAAENPFYNLAPEWGLYPLVALATFATSIASQAMISGAFSITQQAVQLGYIPRVEIVHTSAKEMGQIYVPVVNWALLVGVVFVVLIFQSSSRLAAAYGIAVTTTMVITTLLTYIVVTKKWGWKPYVAILVILPLLSMDLSFFSANVLKILQGGWFPIIVGALMFTLMTTWKTGRQILNRKIQDQVFPFEYFQASISNTPPVRVPGTAVFMTGNPTGTPPALLHNWKHNKVIHEKVVLLTVTTEDIPHVSPNERIEVQKLENGFFRVLARYGFMEIPRIPEMLKLCKQKGLEMRLMETSFFLGRETLIPTKQPGMALWREALFAWMSRNARPATSFFEIPPNRVVELGSQIEL